MTYLIFLFGALITLGSVVLLIRPAGIFSLLAKHAHSTWLHLLAIVVRIALGAALIVGASESAFPGALRVLGWLSILSGCVLLVVGRARFQSLIKWALEAGKSVEFLSLPDEDHYLSMEKNRIATFKAMDAFLDKCLPVVRAAAPAG
jgi:hypothetical protein